MAERDRVVQDGACPQRGFDAIVISRPDPGDAVVGGAASWFVLLGEPPGRLRLRHHPVDGSWTAPDHACHTRDVLEVQRRGAGPVRAPRGPPCRTFGSSGFLAPGGTMNLYLGGAIGMAWVIGVLSWGFRRAGSPEPSGDAELARP